MDSNGYLSTEDTEITEYDWDHRNRLTAVTDRATYQGATTQTVEYAYDYQNRLVAKTLDPDGAGPAVAEETHFIHDGNQIVLEFDDNDALSHRYLWGAAVDQILADEAVDDGSAEDVLWTLTDHLNTVRDIIDSTGTIENHLTYDAYGNITSETNQAVDHLFAFTGKMFDKDTGLQNNHNRWYDAEVGRWLSEDPISFDGGDANLYRYVGNGPTNLADPLGLVADPPYDVPRGGGGGGVTPDIENIPPIANEHAEWKLIWQGFGTSFSKTDYLNKNPPLTLPSIPTEPPPRCKYVGTQGTHKIYPDPSVNQWVGGDGAASCVVVVIFCLKGKPPSVVAFHFGAGDKPTATLSQYDWPEGSSGVIAGGDDSGPSNAIYKSVVNWFKGEGNVTLVGAIDQSGVYRGYDGWYYYDWNSTRKEPK